MKIKIHYFIPIIVILSFWELGSIFQLIDARFLPSASRILYAILQEVITFNIFSHVGWSILRVVLAFSVSASFGIFLGILVGCNKRLHPYLIPVIEIIRPIPPLAWIPLAILWFGLGLGASVFIIFIGGFFPIFTNTLTGVENVDRKYLEFAKILGANKKETVKKVVVPSSLPHIFSGLKIGLGISWMCLVAAEMFGENTGLGYFIIESMSLMRPDKVIAGMIVVGLIGAFLICLIKIVEKRVIKWK